MTSRAYRIGYLNPFRERAENQCKMSLGLAAARLGHEMVGVATSQDIIEADLDFVIAIATAQPKLTDIPTFGNIHEPKVRVCGEEQLFGNVLTYDGNLTISQSLVDFLESLNSGLRRSEGVGFFYITPQVSEFHADIPAIVAAGRLQLCYFGTNWDRRARPLLRALALKPYTRIHGPEEGWRYLVGSLSFKGPTPFDGVSVQKTYAAHGVGLVVQSREHRLDDVISNRIFEIASVGSIAVCPYMPWIRENFGSTVSYYTADKAVAYNLAEIDEILAEITAEPAAAAARGQEARQIFEARYSAEKMIQSAVTYFEGWRAMPAPAGPPEPVDVILRLNGGSSLERGATIASLQAQTTGAVRLIVAGLGAEETARSARRGVIVEALAAPSDPGPSATLKAGLAAVRNPLFAVVDEGDVWLRNHMAETAQALAHAPEGSVIFSLVVDEAGPGETGGAEHRRLRPWPEAEAPLIDSLAGLGLEGMTAPSALLGRINLSALMDGPQADAVLLGLLLEQADPVYTYRPTTVARRKASGGGAPAYSEADNVTALLRLGPAARTAEDKLPCPLGAYWRELSSAIHDELNAKAAGEEEAYAVEGGSPVPSIHERPDDLVVRQIVLDGANLWGQPGTEMAEDEFGAWINVAMPAPHAYCASINLRDELFEGPQWIVAEFADIQVPFRVGVVNRTTEEMLELDTVPMIKDHMEVWIRIEKPAPASYIIMAGDTVQDAKLRLVGLWLAQYPDAPAAA